MLIYKLISPNTDLVYVGHTDRTLSCRLSLHRSHYKRWLAGIREGVCSSIKVLEHGDYSIVLIEETEDADREGYWIRELNACNKMTYEYSGGDKVAYHKARYQEKRDGILARMLEKIPCDNCGRIVCRGAMAKHKRTDRCVNKEPIRERKLERAPCDNCGQLISRGNMWRHKTSKICM
jgi:hypothetical protein